MKQEKDDIALISYTSNNFLKWAEIYLKSLKLSNPDVKVFMHCINVTEENQKKLVEWNQNVIVSPINIKYDGIQERISGSGPEAMWKIMMHCQVSKAILAGLESNVAKRYILTDVDMLITSAFTKNLINLDCDIGLCFTKEHIHRNPPQILNGAIYINTESQKYDAIKEFFKMYDTMNDTNIKHYVDQTKLYECFEKFKNKLRIVDLGFDYFLNFFVNNAIMWSAHRGDKNKNYKLFKKALKENNIQVESKDNYEK